MSKYTNDYNFMMRLVGTMGIIGFAGLAVALLDAVFGG